MKWEYKIIGISRRENEQFFNYTDLVTKNFDVAGVDGWELVSVDNGIAFFKRPINESVESKNVNVSEVRADFYKQVYDD